MTDWLTIREILEDALEQEPSQRARFIAAACEGNVELRREVEAYLRYDAAPGRSQSLPVQASMLEDPALATPGETENGDTTVCPVPPFLLEIGELTNDQLQQIAGGLSTDKPVPPPVKPPVKP